MDYTKQATKKQHLGSSMTVGMRSVTLNQLDRNSQAGILEVARPPGNTYQWGTLYNHMKH